MQGFSKSPMTRETTSSNKIALLATGDEICHGDILNSNSQEISRRLFSHGIEIGTHLAVPDLLFEIEKAIHFLLSDHRAIVITGGLGPTSDDLTRYAVSNATQRELIFDDATWNAIVLRLKRFGYETPPETNKRQALFPKGAVIIQNPNGTAAGCFLKLGEQFIFMLPGPPPECLPMIDNTVLPALLQAGFQQVSYHQKWLLFGVSEGQIAEELDALAKPFDCVTGYRLWYPYIEFKLHSNNQKDFTTLVQLVEKTVAPYLFSDGKKAASQLLKNTLEHLDYSLSIIDTATGGLLESTIKTPATSTKVSFIHNANADVQIEIKGLNEFWQQKNDATKTTLEISFTREQKTKRLEAEIPFRGSRVRNYALEFISSRIWEYLTTRETAVH